MKSLSLVFLNFHIILYNYEQWSPTSPFIMKITLIIFKSSSIKVSCCSMARGFFSIHFTVNRCLTFAIRIQTSIKMYICFHNGVWGYSQQMQVGQGKAVPLGKLNWVLYLLLMEALFLTKVGGSRLVAGSSTTSISICPIGNALDNTSIVDIVVLLRALD